MNPAIIKEKIMELPYLLMGLLDKIKGIFSVQLAKAVPLINKVKTGKSATAAGPAKKHAAESAPVDTKIHGFFAGKIDFVKSRFLRVFDLSRFPAEKRKPILIVFGGLCALFLILIISALALNSGKSKKDAMPERMAGIPHEELFSPAEPDFLPKFLLEREPRRFWTVEDARPYWKSPGNPDFWQGEIKTAVDKLLEGVP